MKQLREDLQQLISQKTTQQTPTEELVHKLAHQLRPYLPTHLNTLNDGQLIGIALGLIVVMSPCATAIGIVGGAAICTAENISLFTMDTAKTTLKAGYSMVKTTVSTATDILIKKPIYLLTYPFRKKSRKEEIIQLVETCKLQQGELQQYRKMFQQQSKMGKLLLIIRQIPQKTSTQQGRVIIGSLESTAKVDCLFPLIRRSVPQLQTESIQLVCNGMILKNDSAVDGLPRNEMGAIEIYFVFVQTFG